MLIPKRVTAIVGAVLLLYSAQTASAQESQQSPSATDIPDPTCRARDRGWFQPLSCVLQRKRLYSCWMPRETWILVGQR